MEDILFNQKLLFVEQTFNIKITPYRRIDGKEIGSLKSGGELILEYQKLLAITDEALLSGKITKEKFTQIKTYLAEIYNKYIVSNGKLNEGPVKKKIRN